MKTERKTLAIQGMHCASCANKIEKALLHCQGVQKAVVNFATEKAMVEYDSTKTKPEQLVQAVEGAGYKVILPQKSNILHLKVIGMDNDHCVSTVAGGLKNVKGILSKELTTTEKATITYDQTKITPLQIVQAIKDVGYQALEKSAPVDTERLAREKEMSGLKWRTVVAVILAVPLIGLSMLAPSLGIPLPSWMENNLALIEFLLATPVMIAGSLFFSRGIGSVIKAKTATMDTLVALGTGTAYVYSLFISISIWTGEAKYSAHDLYYEVAALLIAFILLGKYLEAMAKGKTSEAIKKLIGLQPKTALVLRGRKEVEIPIDQVKVGDVVIVKPGQKIPIDGVVLSGHSTIDESMVTGESIPIEKQKGSKVIGATINKAGALTIKATSVGADTLLAQIIKLVEEAQGSKAPIQKLADRVSAYFVPVVIVLALGSFSFWYLWGLGTAFALETLVAVLIIACPCAMGLATPTAIMVGTGKAAEQGILIKSAEALQKAQEVNTIVFDKTGTLTKGKPEVTDLIPMNKFTKKDLLLYAAIAEKRSEHPLAEAIIKKAEERKLAVAAPQRFWAISGKGLEAVYNKKTILLGNRRLMEDKSIGIKGIGQEMEKLEDQGKTVMIVAVDKKVAGLIAVADTLKEHSKDAVELLQKLKKRVILMTGDNQRTGNAIARQLGIREVLAEILPADKAKEIQRLQQQGRKAAMVGDGINDAPALAQADVGIAMGTGTDVAIESGDIVLIKGDLRDVVTALDLSKFTMRKIKQNLFWAFFYNALGIPVAAGILYPVTGWLLSPIIAGAAMAFSSVSVLSNSLSMKRYKPKW